MLAEQTHFYSDTLLNKTIIRQWKIGKLVKFKQLQLDISDKGVCFDFYERANGKTIRPEPVWPNNLFSKSFSGVLIVCIWVQFNSYPVCNKVGGGCDVLFPATRYCYYIWS